MGTVEMYADVMEEATNRVLTPLLVQEQELQIVRCHKTSHVEVVELIEYTFWSPMNKGRGTNRTSDISQRHVAA